jgi:Flp pilus assembly secretin CpaC
VVAGELVRSLSFGKQAAELVVYEAPRRKATAARAQNAADLAGVVLDTSGSMWVKTEVRKTKSADSAS